MFRHRSAVAGGLAAALLATVGPAGIGADTATASTPSAPSAPSAPAGQRPALTDAAPCEGEPEFVCSTLRVPLDHTGRVDGSLDLAVAAARNVDAPRGVLLLLTGGP